MRSWLVAVGLAAATTVGGVNLALSADLNYRDEPNRYGSAYDDPRYADLYGSRPPAPPIHPRPYAYGYGPPPGPIPPAPIYRDYERPPIHRPYAEAPPHRYGSRSGCVPKDEVKFELQREGWTDFHDAQVIDGHTAIVRARRDRNGRLFELKVDRCTGEVVSARPLEPRPGPYADYDANRRYRAY